MRMPHWLTLAILVLATSCKTDPSKTPTEQTLNTPGEGAPALATLDSFEPVDTSINLPLEYTAEDGRPPGESFEALPRPETKALTKAQIEQIYGRLPELKSELSDKKDFAKRASSTPPPKTGTTVVGEFPPESDRERPDVVEVDATTQLEVVRYQPEGDVPLAPKVSVTFNLPMVAVTSHDDTIKDGVPVQISPMPEGKWRWVGAKTLLFETFGQRMPMATEYTVTVPAATKSMNGNEIAEAKSFTFSTPPVTIQQFYPTYGTFGLNQPIFMAFDQDIKRSEIIEHIKVQAGGKFIPMKLASAAKMEADDSISALIKDLPENRWIALEPSEPFPYNSTITFSLEAGAPSAEGPRKTTTQQQMSFQTYGPLTVTEHRCGWRGCSPYDAFSFRLSNQLDGNKWNDTNIKVEPSYPSMVIHQSGNYLTIGGMKPGRRKYTVTLSDKITDEFGQELQGERTFTFDVGAAHPSMVATAGQFVVLDPAAGPRYTVFTTNYKNIRLKAWSVKASDWKGYLAYSEDWRYYGKKTVKPPGKLVFDDKIKVNEKPDELVQTDIDLSKQFGKGNHLLIEITAGDISAGAPTDRSHRPEYRTWIHRTNIGLDALVDYETFTGWATDLKTGKPLKGVKIELPASNVSGVTGDDGTVKIKLPNHQGSDKVGTMVATRGDDVGFLPEVFYSQGSTSFYNSNPGSELRWMVFDDRGMYKPNEEVSLKGFVRNINRQKGGDMSLISGGARVNWRVMDAQGVELAKGNTETTTLGGFHLTFKLPDTPNLGYGQIIFDSPGYHTHAFQIQEFRTPEFEVKASAPEGPHLADDDATATVSAKYYAGGVLSNAEVTWSINSSDASYTPPNQSKYSFGMWTPWWQSSTSSGASSYQSLSSKTDAAGEHTVHLKFGKGTPPKPVSIKASATVMDVNRQAWSTSTNLLVHPSLFYVGMRSERYFVEQGKPLEIKLVVSDIDGNLTANRPVKVRASRVKYSWKNSQYIEEMVDTQECDFTSSEAEHTCTFKTDVGGTYKIAATTTDDYGRLNYTEITRWVSGGIVPVSKKIVMEAATLIPDKEIYAPGDTAEILVQSPFVPAEGIMTIRRNGIVEQKRFTMNESTTVLNIPVKSAYIPNFYVGVDLVGAAPRLNAKGEPDTKLPTRPAIASGMLAMKVPPTERTLSVAINPAQKRLAPGTKTTVDLEVKDAAGKPVKDAEVAIIVVDEAILAMSSYAMKDPMAIFYSDRADGMRAFHQRTYVELVDPAALEAPPDAAPGDGAMEGSSREMMKKSAPRSAARSRSAMPSSPAPAMEAMADSMAMDEELSAEPDVGGDPNAPIAVRTNFNPLALFAPATKTDASGKVRVNVEMPDNLTRYRVMAVAVVDSNKFGTGESNVTARLPVMVRPSAPRFLNFGDKFELPIVVQNQTDDLMTVFVATRASNLNYTAGQGVSVQVPANDRVEVRFPATTEEAGTARFQVGVSADTKVGNFADAAEISLPVWTPATSEAFATYGEIDKGSISQPVKLPEEVWPQFGELQVTTSSTAMQALTDAFLYLYHYQYQCAEQISSRMISVVALRDVLTAFKAEGMPSKSAVEASMKRDIKELLDRQNGDGGFGFWRRGQPSWPYVSLHAAHALQRAKLKGYEVDDRALRLANSYLINIERHIPHYYGEWTRLHIISYSLYVRGLMGDYDTTKAREVMRRAGKLEALSFEAVGWLMGVFTNKEKNASELVEIRRFLANRVTETAGNAHFAASMNDGHHLILHSDRRADGVILEALMDDQPKSDLVPKIVKGLMAHRKKGRWGNTQENAHVLLALDKYFNIYEKETPDFVARIWLGDQFAGEHTFKGRTTEQHHVDIPMRYMAENAKDTKNLYLQKDGKGRMYYRIGMNYAPKSLFLEPADHGFAVERSYEGMDNPDDVKRRADGIWEVKAGARVKVKLTMVAETRRYHVALVDPLPAGFETLNPALATTEDLPQDQAMNTGGGRYHWWWWSRPWFEHQNMRDERTEAFTTLLWGGVHEYTYYARATTPGEFIVPPTKAEEMYSPETFGRSSSDRVVVK